MLCRSVNLFDHNGFLLCKPHKHNALVTKYEAPSVNLKSGITPVAAELAALKIEKKTWNFPKPDTQSTSIHKTGLPSVVETGAVRSRVAVGQGGRAQDRFLKHGVLHVPQDDLSF